MQQYGYRISKGFHDEAFVVIAIVVKYLPYWYNFISMLEQDGITLVALPLNDKQLHCLVIFALQLDLQDFSLVKIVFVRI